MPTGVTGETDTLIAALARDPTRGDLAPALAARATVERREEDAIAPLAEAARRRPGDATLLQWLGLLHRAVGDLAPAIAALDAAVALAPADARLVHARARAALEAGLPSLEWFARARALAPMDGDVILGEAAALLAERRTADADALLADMLQAHPGWLTGHAALIRLRHAHGAADRATHLLDQAIAGAPGDARLHQLAVTTEHRASRAERARAAVARAETHLGPTPVTLKLAAIVAAEHGSQAEGDAAFAAVDPRASADLQIHWMRHLLRRGEPERVVAFAESLTDRSAAWSYLSLAWRLTGDARGAWLDDPALVREFDLELAPDELEGLAARLRTLHTSRAQPLDQSVRGGTQTDGPLFSRLEPEIAGLKARVRAAVTRYFAELPARDPTHPLTGRVPRHPRFAGSWSVRLTGGGRHDAHVHCDGLLSSACYVALPDDPGELTLGEPQSSLRLPLAPARVVTPRPGRLVLFPSTLWHATRPFAHGERLTVAFDVA